MPKTNTQTDLLKCSFCGKDQEHVNKLIAGPGIYICDECVALCVEIVAASEQGLSWTWRGGTSGVPDDAIADLDTDELLTKLYATATFTKGADANLRQVVAALRARGTTWARIGEALGISRQAAWDRFAGED